MPARVTLMVTRGENLGEEFVFEERTTCILGRAPDCRPRILIRENPRLVSRHHCLLDINPPDIRVRDFGSLNGTLVNEAFDSTPTAGRLQLQSEMAEIFFRRWELYPVGQGPKPGLASKPD